MREFKIDTKPYDNYKIYKKASFQIEEGITVLVGCNGSGKTTLLNHIRYQLDDKDIKYINYSNLSDGGSNARSNALFYGQMDLFVSQYASSEGEEIMINLSKLAAEANKLHRSDDKEVWILIDATDSGLSVDNVIDLKSFLNLIIKTYKDKDKKIYIVISANEYEMCIDNPCFDVQSLKYVTFKTYNAYRNLIIRTRKWKDKQTELYNNSREVK